MTKLDADTFVTVDQAGDILNVKRRTIDRYAEEGALEKYKLGKRRSGFKLADLEAHIAKLNGKPVPGAGSPALTPAVTKPDYQSPGSGMLMQVDGMLASEAEAFNRLLVKLGFPGIMVMLSHGNLILTWPDALGYTEDMIERKVGKAVRKGERVA